MGKGSRHRKERKLTKDEIYEILNTREGHDILFRISQSIMNRIIDDETACILFVLDKALGFRKPRLLKFLKQYDNVTEKLKYHWQSKGNYIKDSDVSFFADVYLKQKYGKNVKELIEEAILLPDEDISLEA